MKSTLWRSTLGVVGVGRERAIHTPRGIARLRARTVDRAAAAGRPKAQSAVGLSGMGGLQGVAPVKGGSGLYRHGQL